MALVPIEHEHRLGSPAEAEALFRALRDRRVSARGFATDDAERIARVAAAIEPGSEHAVFFEGGTLSIAELGPLARGAYGYLDLRTAGANLRVWPGLRAWVEGGEPDHLETTSIDEALTAFRAIAGPLVTRGSISGLQTGTHVELVRFLAACGARANAVIELDVAVARGLAEEQLDEPVAWQSERARVDLPEGRITGYLVTPKTGERHRARWHKRIDRALRRAGLA